MSDYDQPVDKSLPLWKQGQHVVETGQLSDKPEAAQPLIVELSRYEAFIASQAGMLRRLDAIRLQRGVHHGIPPLDPWGKDIEAAAAEMAVAKALGRFLPITDELVGDVSGGVEVRWTRRKDGRLIVHLDDKDHLPYVLVRGVQPRFELCGWMLGFHAKKQQYWHPGDGRAAFFVPTTDLRPICELIAPQALHAAKGS